MKTKTPLFDLIDNLSNAEIFFIIMSIIVMIIFLSMTVNNILETRELEKARKREQEAINELKKINNEQAN